MTGAAPVVARPADGVGASPGRPDGMPKVMGQFAYASDLWADGMLWGTTLRSPHPYARMRGLDSSRALALPGVRAILTHEDVPGRKTYGLEVPDQPVLAIDVVRYQGEPVAIVAADHPETARRAAELIEVDYEPLEPLVDMERAVEVDEPRLHEGGNVLRRIHVRHGDVAAARVRGRCRGGGRVRARHAGPGVPRPRVRARDPRRGRRGRPLRGDAVAPRRPQPDRVQPGAGRPRRCG